jgi:hypothetical protein
MTNKYYTPEGKHPEDAIFKAKTFINELEAVQENYFNKLVSELNLTKEGEEWLFDYVYNTPCEDNFDDFQDYLRAFKKTYKEVVANNLSCDSMYNNSVEPLMSTDFEEFSPMVHMSSYESDLETTFSSPYDNSSAFSELDTITIDTKNANKKDQI